jgi:hypothetical protein
VCVAAWFSPKGDAIAYIYADCALQMLTTRRPTRPPAHVTSGRARSFNAAVSGDLDTERLASLGPVVEQSA